MIDKNDSIIGIWDGVEEHCEGWECCTIGDKLTQWAELYKDKIAVTDTVEKVSYLELDHASKKLGYYFKNNGIRQGDLVLLQLSNSITFLKTLFALFKIGAVPVMLLPAHREYEIEGIIRYAKPIAYISLNNSTFQYEEMARRIVEKNPVLKHLFLEDQLKDQLKNNSDEIDESKLGVSISYNDIAVMLLSGGTTGIPKLIPRTHGDYLYFSKTAAKKIGCFEHTIHLIVLPAAHNFALAAPGILGVFSAGGRIVLSEYASPVDIFDLIEQEKVNMVSLVPTLVTMCLDYRKIDATHDLSSLDKLITGGAKLLETVAARIITELGCTLIQEYGMAEGLLCATSWDDPKEIVINYQGKPCSSYDLIKIVDSEGRCLPRNTEGEILTKGPYTIRGYYNNKQVNQESFTEDGFYKTGDKGLLSFDGNIKVLGRVKEQINRAGEKIMPTMLEELLKGFEEIQDSCVVGIPDSVLGNRICCFIISSNKDLSLKHIRDFLIAKGVSEYRLPDEIVHVENWPLTAVGKVDRNKLCTLACER